VSLTADINRRLPHKTAHMSRWEVSLQTTSPHSSKLRRRVVRAAAILVVLFLLVFGRETLGRWCRSMAGRRMSVWAVSDAQAWLDWSRRLDPDNGETDLMKAACFRRLGQNDRWAKAMRSAEKKGTPARQIQRESTIALLQSGELQEGAERQLIALVAAGVPQQDAVAAFVHGCLARNETERSKRMLDVWSADAPDDAHNACMLGVYWSHSNDTSKAIAEFKNALAKEPCHELARTAIAELHEKQGRLDQALDKFVEAAKRFPASETARLGLARVTRKLARADEARFVLRTVASQVDPSSAISVEMGQIELECGNYQEAERWFARAHPAELTPLDTLASTGIAAALAGKPGRADRLFALVIDRSYVPAVRRDLQVRLLFDPNARQVADELEGLTRSSLDESALAKRIQMELDEDEESAYGPMPAAELYALQCGACHGANGDGHGRAARYLFPKPRDLRTGMFRLVSTSNAVPTQQDVEDVIRRGMPGTSMPSFDDLGKDDQGRLAQEVLRLRREGIREEFVATFEKEEEEIDEHEVDAVVEHLTTPRRATQVPRFGPANSKAIEIGRDLYFRQSCDSCHGKDGCGDRNLPLFDDRRRPTRARDLAHEPFRGGHEPEAVYRRILLGMPGTPHPASKNLTSEQMIALVHYCRSIERQPKRASTNHQRSLRATGRAYLSAQRTSPGKE